MREAGLPGSTYVPGRPETWEGWEDSAVPRDKLGGYLRDLRALFDRYGYQSPMYGHFGDGLVHTRISYDIRHEKGVETWRRFLDEAADLVVRYGGSLSGEHGDGQAKAALLEKMYGPELIGAFREFKRIWDPDGRMNPGKVVDPYPITSNLRLGPSYRPPKLKTWFDFAEVGGFPGAAERCVGVGICRRTDTQGEVMCPSYRRRARRSTAPAAAPACCSRCCMAARCGRVGGAGPCTRRCTSAWPARDARATAPYMSIWPPTRPNSTPTTTAAGCAPAWPTAWV